jgi:hypothetical protein
MAASFPLPAVEVTDPENCSLNADGISTLTLTIADVK